MAKSYHIIILVLLPILGFAQSNQDTSFLETSVLRAEKTYHHTLSKQLNIYNGRGYKAYTSIADEHPYFLTDDWIIGSIVYESDYYAEVPLLFDLSSEKVYSENPSNGIKMELVYNKIDRFEIQNHVFVKLHQGLNIPPDMSEGFYEILYDGKLKLYAQRKKNLQTRTRGDIMYPEFEEKNKYLLFNGTSFKRVSNKKTILKALGDNDKLPKPSAVKIDQNTNNKLENKLIHLIKFYDLHYHSL